MADFLFYHRGCILGWKKNQKTKKKKKSHGCWGRAPWLLGGGTAVAMAIVTSALMRDHQIYVFGTARPDLNKDLKTVLRTYDAGSTCNPVVPYLCRQTSTMADKASKGKGISKARAPLERRRISKTSARAIGETTEEEELLVVVLGEREGERSAKEKNRRDVVAQVCHQQGSRSRKQDQPQSHG